MTWTSFACALADANQSIPDRPMTLNDLENLSECALKRACFAENPARICQHIAQDDVPRLVREIMRLRAAAGVA